MECSKHTEARIIFNNSSSLQIALDKENTEEIHNFPHNNINLSQKLYII